MKTMPAGEFKARCLRVMEDVRKYRVPVVITKKGRPVAKLVPLDESRRDILGCMADQFTHIGDVESPVFPPEAWEAFRVSPTPSRAAKGRSRKARR